jgi:hypothetical protein
LVVIAYGDYNAKIARTLVEELERKPALFDPLIEFCVYVVVGHTIAARERDPTIDFDNAYKVQQTYTELVAELRRRIADRFVRSPLDGLPGGTEVSASVAGTDAKSP